MHLDAPTRLFLRLPAHAADYSFHDPHTAEPYWYCGNTRKTGCVYHNHIHKEVEIHHILRGHVRVRVNGTEFTLSPGDILILNPYDNHEGWIDVNESVRFRHTAFDLQKFASACGDAVRGEAAQISVGAMRFVNVIRRTDSMATTFADALSRICDAFFLAGREPVAGDLHLMAEICRLIGCLFETDRICAQSDSRRSVEFIREVSDYTEAHYPEELTTGTVSEAFGYSEGYFCALFRQNFGMTFSVYLNRYRIARAIDLHRDGKLALTELSFRVGYTNYSYFSRCFKQYTGMSPSAYLALKFPQT